MEESLVGLFNTMPYLISFLGGILTFLSPCILPLIPAYLSYISGLSFKKLSGSEEISSQDRLQIAMASLSFIFGFGLVFVLLGAVVENTIGDILQSREVAITAGVIIVVFGLHTMKLINIKFLNFEARANFGDNVDNKKSFFVKLTAPFILGLSFALGWTPCVGPILGSIITYAGQEDGGAVLLMTMFALGLGVPFFLSAILTSYAIGFMNRIKKHFRIIEIVSGLLLIVIGIAIAFGSLDVLTGELTDLIESPEDFEDYDLSSENTELENIDLSEVE
jgi:cytochrome c-type biogenesis protein